MTGRVTYGGYGSNLLLGRLRTYIEGAPATGPYGAHRGSADRQPPGAPGALVALPGRLYFGAWSARWGGGVAFVDLEAPGTFLCRPYDLSVQQLRDLVAQENGTAVDEAGLPAGLGVDPTPFLVGGRYDLLASVPSPAGGLVRVVTSSVLQPPAAPSPAYLGVIAAGLREAGLTVEAVRTYLLAATGALLPAADVDRAVPG